MSAKWAKQAQEKLESGEWKPTPWSEEEWYLAKQEEYQHFSHISVRDCSQVAYVADYNEELDKMRIISGKPGRYLSKFYADVVGDSLIRSYANKIAIEAGEIEVCFATEPEEIREIYENGPRSCMSRDASDYTAKIHPCSIYGAGDLAVAYTKNKNDRIISRTVCWPDQEIFSTVYGDGGDYDSLLEAILEERGWIQNSDGLDGAKCLKIKHERGYVAPYLDGGLGFNVEDKHLIIKSRSFRYRGGSEMGVIGNVCYECDDEIDGNSLEFDGHLYCECCWSDVAFNCNECGDVHSQDDGHYVDNGWGHTVCEDCFGRFYSECDDCHEVLKQSDITEAPDRKSYCESCYADNVSHCEVCDSEELYEDLMRSDRDNMLRCDSCNDDHEADYDDCKECGDDVEIAELSEGLCSMCEESRGSISEDHLEEKSA